MVQIARPDLNVTAFASNADNSGATLERPVFGRATVSDSLTANITSEFLRGWEQGQDINGYPPMGFFNAFGFTSTQMISYLFQRGVADWHASQEFYSGAVTNRNGTLYIANADTTGQDPAATPAVWQPITPVRKNLLEFENFELNYDMPPNFNFSTFDDRPRINVANNYAADQIVTYNLQVGSEPVTNLVYGADGLTWGSANASTLKMRALSLGNINANQLTASLLTRDYNQISGTQYVEVSSESFSGATYYTVSIKSQAITDHTAIRAVKLEIGSDFSAIERVGYDENLHRVTEKLRQFMPIAWSSQYVPAGYIPMDGRALNTTDHPYLMHFYGVNVPDMRGDHVRGWDGSTDPIAARDIIAKNADSKPRNTYASR